MKRKDSDFAYWCTGCGLCHSAEGINFYKNQNGFMYPNIKTSDNAFYEAICPIGGKNCNGYEKKKGQLWGNVIGAYVGAAKDRNISFRGSSGGILTALAIYLLENGFVNGIIQTKSSEKNILENVTTISRNRTEIMECTGARYISTAPLYDIKSLVKENEKYVFIGKPCDVKALKNYITYTNELTNIIYFFSFFCAGVPSEKANIDMLTQMGCEKEDCVELKYRGNGWPGKTTIKTREGKIYEMEYEEAWGKILGRNIRNSCRFCIDGVGDWADISCGDYWHTTQSGKVDFSEHDGRNVILVRTQKGKDILELAKKSYIDIAELYDYYEKFKIVQQFQYERKASMKSMLSALKLLGRNVPSYDAFLLNDYQKDYPLIKRMRRFLGIIWRAIQGKI